MPQGEKVTDRSFIFMILKRLQQQKLGVNVTIPRKSGNFTTSLLDINTSEPETLVFDELTPAAAQQQLEKSRIMEVHSNLNGVKIRMQCHLQKVDRSEEICKNVVSFPPHLWYFQQRESFRVQLGDDLSFSARIKFRSSEWLNAQLTDVSHSGLGIIIDEFVPFEHGELIKLCELTLPSGETIFCKVIIRHVFHDDHHNQTQLGGKIIELEGNERKRYIKAIHDAQREMIRRQSRTADAG